MSHSDNMTLQLSWEWEPADGVRAPELAATLARLEIVVADEHITLVEDRQSSSSRRAIRVSLYPLAEWIAYNWWSLQADSRVSSAGTRYGQKSMRQSGDGFIWPDLRIVPEGSSTHLTWTRDRTFAPGSTIRYLTQGEARVDSASVQFALADVVSNVIDRLIQLDVRGTPLEEEWTAIQNQDAEEREFCIASARLGLDPYTDGPKYEAEILAAYERLPSELLVPFYDVVEPDHMAGSINWIIESLVAVDMASRGVPTEISAVRALVQPLRIDRADTPWSVGWRQARAVRHSLGLAPSARLDLRPLLSSTFRPSADRGMQAIGTSGPSASNLVVIGQKYPPIAERFTLARALWHIVASHSPRFLVTISHTHDQRIERAFAAELLAPAEGIADVIDSAGSVPEEDLVAVAERFDVATTVIEHQLQNQLLGAAQ